MGRALSAGTAFVTYAGLLCYYVFMRGVPFSDVYLGPDRTEHNLVFNGIYLVGLLLFLGGYWGRKRKYIQYPLYVLSFLFLIVAPVLNLIGNARSFRGLEWAFWTMMISLLPFVFLIVGVLVLFKIRLAIKALLALFSIMAAYHLVLFIKNLREAIADRAFNTTTDMDVVVAGVIAFVSGLFAFIQFKALRQTVPLETHTSEAEQK
jgi:hypothetical protein